MGCSTSWPKASRADSALEQQGLGLVAAAAERFHDELDQHATWMPELCELTHAVLHLLGRRRGLVGADRVVAFPEQLDLPPRIRGDEAHGVARKDRPRADLQADAAAAALAN